MGHGLAVHINFNEFDIYEKFVLYYKLYGYLKQMLI